MKNVFQDRGLVRSSKQRAIFSEFICEMPTIAGPRSTGAHRGNNSITTANMKKKYGSSSSRVKADRKNKMYATQNIVALLNAQGVNIDAVEAALRKPLPLSAFDDAEYNQFPAEQMLRTSAPHVSAQIYVTKSDVVGDRCGEWLNGIVTSYNTDKELFECEVRFPSEESHSRPGRHQSSAVFALIRPRILICFDGEDPFVYALRVAACLQSQRRSEMRMLYNLYVDCMPTDEMASLDGEQIGRISTLAVNTRKLQHHVMAEDTAKIMQDVGMDYVRTMNKARQITPDNIFSSLCVLIQC